MEVKFLIIGLSRTPSNYARQHCKHIFRIIVYGNKQHFFEYFFLDIYVKISQMTNIDRPGGIAKGTYQPPFKLLKGDVPSPFQPAAAKQTYFR